jgi:hypothetical protein
VMVRKAKAVAPKHWKVRFTRRGMEPPMPFGKTTAVVCALSRQDAVDAVPASLGYPVTASATKDAVTWPNRCRCLEVSSAGAGASSLDAVEPAGLKTSAQLEREITAALVGAGEGETVVGGS